MSLGTTLAKALLMLKSQVGASITVGVADDDTYRFQIETKQEWFASMYDWDNQKDSWDATIAAGALGQYTTFPTTDTYGVTTNSINFDREVIAWILYSSKWRELDYGITEDNYNIFNVANNEFQSPVLRWRTKESDRTKFEVWPVGQDTQTIRFTGQRKVKSLRTAGVLDPALTLDLDDRLVTLAVAVDILTAKDDQAAKAKGEMLRSLWNTLRAAEGKYCRSFGLSPNNTKHLNRRVVPITTA